MDVPPMEYLTKFSSKALVMLSLRNTNISSFALSNWFRSMDRRTEQYSSSGFLFRFFVFLRSSTHFSSFVVLTLFPSEFIRSSRYPSSCCTMAFKSSSAIAAPPKSSSSASSIAMILFIPLLHLSCHVYALGKPLHRGRRQNQTRAIVKIKSIIVAL